MKRFSTSRNVLTLVGMMVAGGGLAEGNPANLPNQRPLWGSARVLSLTGPPTTPTLFLLWDGGVVALRPLRPMLSFLRLTACRQACHRGVRHGLLHPFPSQVWGAASTTPPIQRCAPPSRCAFIPRCLMQAPVRLPRGISVRKMLFRASKPFATSRWIRRLGSLPHRPGVVISSLCSWILPCLQTWSAKCLCIRVMKTPRRG